MVAAAPAPSGGTLIPVPSDTRARYYALWRKGPRARPEILTQRIGPSGTSYALREYSCPLATFRYLGEGDTREAAEARRSASAEMAPLTEGSISSYVGAYACRNSAP